MKVLVVEDAPDLVEIIGLSLGIRWPGTDVLASSSGLEALRLAETQAFDLVILDLGLPDVDGLEVLQTIRGRSRVPIIVVTGRAAVADRVKGLEMGADDYITKPFSQTELVARVNAVLRRDAMGPGAWKGVPSASPHRGAGHHYRYRGPARRHRRHGGQSHADGVAHAGASRRNEGRVVSHEMLAKQVWGTDYLDTSTIKMGVRRLRQKLGDDAQRPRVIRTHRGMGYGFGLAGREKDGGQP